MRLSEGWLLLRNAALVCGLTLVIVAPTGRLQNADREITRLVADLTRDGRVDTLSIRASSARPIDDREAWCNGGAKDTGRFEISVTLSGRTRRRTLLNDLFKESSLSFSAGLWTIVVADYNGDGRPDFNLGQYAGCNGWQYAIFTMLDDGRVTRLEVEGEWVRVADFANSTQGIRPIPGGFVAAWYDNSRGTIRTTYCWINATNRFALIRETVTHSTETKEPAASDAAGCGNRSNRSAKGR
jgi:hypothetical protein